MVKGTFLVTQQFLKLNGKERKPTVINITSAAAFNATPGLSSYSFAKLAQVQLQRFVATENPNIRAVSLHPGIVLTRLTPQAFVPFAKDTVEIVGGVAVLLASEQAEFMRYLSVNWSVEEIMQRREEILSQDLLSVVFQGKFGYDNIHK
jgi:NAD(P)-dependent dehydrogenase (short-subunit alcohol dehydrogenase family)